MSMLPLCPSMILWLIGIFNSLSRLLISSKGFNKFSFSSSGQEIPEEEKENLLKPLLDINNLESELNMPISHKIIEGHNGSIDIKNADNNNTYIIMLPTLDRR